MTLHRAERAAAIPAVIVAVLVVVTGMLAGSAAALSPITPANRPTPLPGATNGVVPADRLVRVGPNCIAAREAGPSLSRLFAMAREANVALGAEECYRSLADQVKYANQAQQPGANPACVASISRGPNGQPVGNSFHGWGKAVDLTEAGNSLRFGTTGYAFMKRVAGSVGWNHPAFAEPGGSSCPEPWHWEWVGDGGRLGRDTVRGDAVALLPATRGTGYGVVTGLGAIEAHGTFRSRGSVANLPISWVVVAAASTPDRAGYWLIGADGGVFTFGSARFHGSLGNVRLVEPVNGVTPTRRAKGYWLVAWDGGVFSFGDATFHGSMGGKRLDAPVVGIARTPSGNGYWLVASDGGVFAFGDATFHGSMGGRHLDAPVVAITPSRTGNGYWMLASDGGVFAFGDARFKGSMVPQHPVSPAVAMTPVAGGYRILLADATVGSFR